MRGRAIEHRNEAVDRRMADGSAGPSVADPAATGGVGGSSGEARPVNSPTDTSLSVVLGELDRAGWGGEFVAVEGGTVRCLTCRHEMPAATIPADHVRRLEGASDPDDMLIVVPLSCAECATRGVLVAQYGPEASAGSADVVAALSRTPTSGGEPTVDGEGES